MMTFSSDINVNPQQYGIDTFGPVSTYNLDESGVFIPEFDFDVTDEHLTRLHEIDVLAEDGNNGINHFLQILSDIERMQ